MFLWLRLHAPAASREMLVDAMAQHGVVGVPGCDCTVGGAAREGGQVRTHAEEHRVKK